MKIVLVRHLAPLIEPGICYGRLDIPMHSDGTAGLAELAADPAFHGTKRIWTSPARRCNVLGEAIAEASSVPLSADNRLLEFDFGEWEGKPWDDVPISALDLWAMDPPAFRPPGGESGIELIARVRDFYVELCRDGRDCTVVSHGGPLKILIAMLRRQAVDLLATTPTMGEIVTIKTA